MQVKTILTIAGYDPSSGAGITRDLDVFFSLGIHGIAVPTCIVVQGPQGVRAVYPIPETQFEDMLETLGREVHIDGIKTGVMCDSLYVEKTASFLSKHGIPLVVDPIIAAKNGKRLITNKGLEQLIEQVFPSAHVLTPNIEEAEMITGKKIVNMEDMRACAEALLKMRTKAVLIKGGHLQGEPIDLFFDGKKFSTWNRHRIEREIHGTGCMLSSLFVSFLVKGYPIQQAFYASEHHMEGALRASYRIGEGYYYGSPGVLNSHDAAQWKVLSAMKALQQRLYQLNIIELIPEVQMNIGYAVDGAQGIEDVAAFPGRIGRHNGRILIKGEAQFGASSHVARLILTFMKYYPHIKSCASVRYDESYIARAKAKGMYVVFFDRKSEPERIRRPEGKSLDFLVEEVLKGVANPPDLIYDAGDIGKEPIIRLFARNPLELMEKMEMILS